MKKTTEQKILCILFCGFLFGMMLLYLVLPKTDFSELEKRYLAEPVKVSWETLSTGKLAESVDTYMADHIPGRNLFVGINAYYNLLTGRQASGEILLADNSRLAEAPAQPKAGNIEKNMAVINGFAQKNHVTLDLMIVPSAGWAIQEKGGRLPVSYEDEALIRSIYTLTGENVRTMDVLSVFRKEQDPAALYYKTDHHWTSRGAFTACNVYLESLGRTVLSEENYAPETVSGFRGSAYSRSGLWLTPAEDLELWHSINSISVTHEESTQPHAGVFFRERLEQSDMYTVFLDGNHATVRLENPDKAGCGKLLVIRDSFSNCLGGFLADAYETVVLVDLRYHRQPVSELLAEESFDEILICYSIGNFLTDTNMVWLR